MRRAFIPLLAVCAAAWGPAAASGGAQDTNPNTRAAIADLVNAVSYGIPTSPAFALLPGQPSEVTHIVTPADFQSNAASWVDGSRLRSGVAFDWRALASMVGSLEEYRASASRQAWWRTVVSAGTAPAAEKSPDVLVAAGARIPIIDRGDLRLNTGYLRRVREVLGNVLDSCVAPPTMPAAEADKFCAGTRAKADSTVRAIQDSVIASSWNALRFDVGAAGALRARNGYIRTDSISGDRAGVWVGLSHPFVARLPAQVTHVVKASWADADSATAERARFVAGSRIRAFPFGRVGRTVGVSLEAAGVWSEFGAEEKDDSWVHLAGVLEVPLPDVGGLFKNQWVAVSYGGDTGRSDGEGTRLMLRYAVYMNRLLQ